MVVWSGAAMQVNINSSLVLETMHDQESRASVTWRHALSFINKNEVSLLVLNYCHLTSKFPVGRILFNIQL